MVEQQSASSCAGEKIAEQGTAEEATATKACSVGVQEEYQAWVSNVRKEVAELPRGSKR